jgi:hypothetical protein
MRVLEVVRIKASPLEGPTCVQRGAELKCEFKSKNQSKIYYDSSFSQNICCYLVQDKGMM